MIQLLTDGWLAGLTATWWLLAATAGVATILAPLTLAGLLLARTVRQAANTRAGWRLRTLPALRRARAR